jgi:uncharacterized protein (TIGR00251 family)
VNSGPIMNFLRDDRESCTLAVRVQPGAKKTAIAGVYGEGDGAQLKIAVKALPVEGRANETLVVFLARVFSIPKSSIELVSGGAARSKILRIRGVSRADAVAAVSKLAE